MKKKNYTEKLFIYLLFLIFSCTVVHASNSRSINKSIEMLLNSGNPVALIDDETGLLANDDYAKTGPVQRVKVDVVKNDVLTCNNHTLRVITNLDPVAQGTATVEGDYIIFTPSVVARGTTVAIEYGITCNTTEVSAVLRVEVTEYSTPINVVPAEEACTEVMASNVSFGIKQKFIAQPATTGLLQQFHIPLVGDLNGDGKPEIISPAVTEGGTLNTYIRYICIFDGQNGSRVLQFDLNTLGSGYGSDGFRLGATPWHQSPSYLAIADVDRDGIGEIIVCQTIGRGRIYCLKPVLDANKKITGLTKMWDGSDVANQVVGVKSPLPTNSTYEIYGQPTPQIVDLNGDGIPEVIVYNKVYNAQTGKLLMAWGGPASSPTASNVNSASGLNSSNSTNNPGNVSTNATYASAIRSRAMVGRRPSSSDNRNDSYLAVPAIVDIDGDGEMEIITGTRIHKFRFNSLSDHTQNTYTTIEGPTSVQVQTGSSYGTTTTYYLNDGFTRVADIDGDGKLEVIVLQNGSGTYFDLNVLMYVWSYDPNSGTSTVKAASTVYTDGSFGTFGIPFIGDINGHNDGWDGSGYSQKLPEIVFCMGGLNRTAGTGRTGAPLHPQSSFPFTSNPSGSYHLPAFTYDASETAIYRRLKLSWVMAHTDQSNNTGITMFDFNNDGAFDLCYRDEETIRVISPKLGTSDYISAGAGTENKAILFRAAVYSETGFEAPAIADVNMDGSADIIVAGWHNDRLYWANVYVFEHSSGSPKWAPCPPVWNQALYNPLYINEDLTVPARPLSMLTEYSNGTETIRPYNGAWIQQPIVKEGKDYVPVVRQPDALIADMTVTVNGTSSATVSVTIRNDGTASISAQTPIAFYRNTQSTPSIENATFISSNTVGVDIFPNEKITRTYTINGNYNEVLVWARLTDNGTSFPVTGFDDCDLSNNATAAIDCPYLIYTATSAPSSVICGNNGSVMLKAEPNEDPRETPTYQWYRNERVIAGATNQIYFAETEGEYKCYVTEGLCRGFSSSITITKDYNADIAEPDLTATPATGKLCVDGSVVLRVENAADYGNNATYTWYKDGIEFASTNVGQYILTSSDITSGSEDGNYFVYVTSGTCGAKSEEVNVYNSQDRAITPMVTKIPTSGVVCGENGSVLLKVSNLNELGASTYQWYRNDVEIVGETRSWYNADDEGTYKLHVLNTNGCGAFSTGTVLAKNNSDITKPIVSRDPANGELCEGGRVLLSVSNSDNAGFNGAAFEWYKDGESVGTGTYYFATEEGLYFVYAVNNSCSSSSDILEIISSQTTIVTPEIESLTGDIKICSGGSVLLGLTNTVSDATGYQWYKDGVAISGATSTTYRATEPGLYTIKVLTESCYSFAPELELENSAETIENPVIESISGNYVICEEGGEVVLRLNTSYTNATYTWFKNGVEQTNSNGTIYRATEPGSYNVVVGVGECTATSESKVITKPGNAGEIAKPDLNVYPVGANYCEGGNVYISISNVNAYTNPIYKWFKDGVEQSVTTPFFTADVDGDYFVVVEDGGCTSGSTIVNVRQTTGSITEPVIESISGSYIICEDGGEVILRVTNSYTNPTYTWFKDGVALANSNSVLYRASTAGLYTVQVMEGTCSAVSQGVSVTKPGNNGTITKPDLDVYPTNAQYCAGGNVYMTINNLGAYTNPVFSWFKDGVEMNVTTSYITVKTNGNYFVVVTEGGCTSGSTTINVKQGTGSVDIPVIASINGKYEICEEGGEIVLQVTNSNNYNDAVTYTWFKNGIAQANSNSLVFRAKEAGSYSVLVSDASCTAMSDAKQITKPGNTGSITQPDLYVILDDGKYCQGGVVYMSVQNTDAYTNPSYVWFKDGVNLGVVTPYYSTAEEGKYFVVVIDGDCTSGSEEVDVTAGTSSITAPVLGMTPVSGNLCTGGNVYFRVENHDIYTNAVYNWYKDGKIIAANTSKFTYLATETGNYYVQVTDLSCVAMSEEKTVIPGGTIATPQLSIYPESANICGDNGVVLIRLNNSSAYTGATYQWYRDDVAITGATDIMYSATEAGDYYLQITTASCGVVTATTTVTKDGGSIAEINLDVFPPDGRIVGGNPVEMAVLNTTDFTGSMYYWFRGNQIVTSGIDMINYDASTTGIYRLLIVDGSDCATWSREVNVTSVGDCGIENPVVNVIPGLNGSGYDLCLPEGSVLFQVTNTSAYATPAYQWYKDNNPITGATKSTLVVNNDPLLGAGLYRVAVTDQGCTVNSPNHSVVENPNSMTVAPTVSSLPASNILCGESSMLVLRFTNPESFTGATFQWYKNNYAITGATDLIYEAKESGKYRIVVTSGSCMAMSEEIDITLSSSNTISTPVLSKTPNQNSICVNGSIRLEVTNTYTNATYYWYKGNQIVQQGSYPYINVSESGTYFVQVVDENNCSSVSTKEVFNMAGNSIESPVLETYPSNNTICGDNGVVVLRLKNSYIGATYQWYKNHIAITGATDIMYSATEAGDYYLQITTSSCGAVTETITVTKTNGSIAEINLDVFPIDGRIVGGNPVEMSVSNATDFAGFMYYWFSGNQIVASGIDRVNYNASTAGVYRLLIVDGSDCATWSREVNVTSISDCGIDNPVVNVIPGLNGSGYDLCLPEGSVLFQVTNTSAYTTPAYQWYKDNNPITGATNSTLVVNNDPLLGAGLYRVAITDQGCTVNSPNHSVVENPNSMTVAPTVSSLPANNILCGESSVVVLRFTNPESFTGAGYQWYKNNYAIAGATDLIYEAKESGKYRIVVTSGSCMAMSEEIDITLSNSNTISTPVLSKTPNQNSICVNGSIRLEVTNTFTNATYYWYKGNQIVQQGTQSYINISEVGTYFVQVVDGNNCSSVSTKEVFNMSGSSIQPPVLETYPSTNVICGDDGVVVLRLTTSYTGATYQWYRNNTPIANANKSIYSATEAGDYYLEVITSNCGAVSTVVNVQSSTGESIDLPLVSMDPEGILGTNPVTLTFTNVGSYTSPQYYWFKNKTDLLQSNGVTFETAQEGTYNLLVVDDGCARWSDDIVISMATCILEQPVLSVIPSPVNQICGANGSVLMQLTNATDYSNPTYEWYKGSTLVASGVPTLEVKEAGSYRLKVSDAECYSYSEAVEVTYVNTSIEKPVVNRIPDYNICGANGGVMLSFANPQDFSGATYQWYKNNYAIAGATGLIYEVTEPGNYRIVVIDGGCMAMSEEENILRSSSENITKPIVSMQPNSNEICIGGSVRLSVDNTSAYASDATYIWYNKDVQVQSGNISTYVAKEAGTYFVQVINGSCSSTSTRVELTMSTSTTINTPVVETYPSQPSNGSKVICGDNGVVLLRLSTTYSSSTTYQWYRNGVAIANATGIIYQAKEAGSYYIEVKDVECGAISEPVNVIKSSSSFIEKPDVSLDPEDGRIVDGLMATMTLENETDYTSPYYYWFRGEYNRFDNTAYVIAEGNDLTSYSTAQTGFYHLLVVEGTCASISELQKITKEEDCPIAEPEINVVNNVTKVCGENGSVLLQVNNPNDYNTPAYQWYKDNSPIAGATRSTLEIRKGEDGLYQVAITADGCRKVSEATVVVITEESAIAKPVVERTPANGQICGSNGSVLLTFTNVDEFEGYTYQWYKDNYAIAGATNPVYDARQAGAYRVVVSAGSCLAMSVEENITMQPGASIVRPTISKLPNQTAICVNGSIILSVSNSSEYNSGVLYIWYHNNVKAGTGLNYNATEAGTYFVQVVDGTCSSVSAHVQLTMSTTSITTPVVVSYPSSINKEVCGINGVVVFRLTNANQYANPTYQWYRNNTAIAGATDILYSATEAGEYYLQIIDGGCSVISTPVSVVVNPGNNSMEEPQISMFPENGEIPSGGSVELSFNNVSDYASNVSYYWFRNNSELISENTLTYSATQPGRYKLLVVDGDCARWSTELDVVTGCETTQPTLSIVPEGANVVCTPNGAIILQVSNREVYTSPTYQWFNGTNTIQGAQSATLVVTEAGDYRVRVSDGGCRNYSEVATITTNSVPGLSKPVISRIPNGGQICGANGSVILRFTNSADFSGATYQWYKNNYAIAGATELIYEAKEAGNYRIVVINGGCMALSAEESVLLESGSDIQRPVLSRLPNRSEICVNGSIRLSVTNANQYNSPTYIWYRGSEVIQSGSVSSFVATAGGRYFVQVVEGTCSSTSERQNLTIGSTIITEPNVKVYPSTSQVCNTNGVVVFRLTNANDYAGATYQWYRNDEAVSGATGVVFSTTEEGSYYVEVRTIDCYAISTPVEVGINSSCQIDEPVITANPSDAKIVDNVPVVLSLQNTSSYSSSADYYWFRDGQTVVLEDGSVTLSTDVVGWYRLLVVDQEKASWSNEIYVSESVCEATIPLLSVLPQSLNVCGENGAVMLSLKNADSYSSNVTYQWSKDGAGISNHNQPYYIAKEEGLYALKVIDIISGEACVGVSESYEITKSNSTIAALEINMTPSSGNLCLEGSVILFVNNRGAYEDATYQWYKNGIIIPGANGNTYEVKYEEQQENQAVYMAQVIEGSCSSVANNQLVINKTASTALEPQITTSGNVVCGQHGSVILRLTNEADFGNGTKYYQWFYNNELIAGATSSSYEADLGGNYRLQVVAGLCGSFSSEIELVGSASNIAKPNVETAPVSGVICGTQGSVLLYLTNTNEYTNPVYQWYKNNVPIVGATEFSYEAKERAYYRIQVSEGECTALSVQKLIQSSTTEITRPTVETTPASVTELCGVNGSIIMKLTNEDQFTDATYVWFKDNLAVPNSNSVMLNVSEPGNYKIQVVEGQCASFSAPIDVIRNSNHIAKPAIESIPANGQICDDGGAVLLTVSNSTEFTGATYLWYRGTQVVQNSTKSVYEADAEGDYFVQVIEGDCSSTSEKLSLSISTSSIAKAVIASTSSSNDICGDNGVVILTLTNVSDYTSPTYQWYRNNVAISGATSMMYIAKEAGDYRILVGQGACSTFSEEETVNKVSGTNNKPILSSLPENNVICGDQGSVWLSVDNVSDYNAPVTYIWYRGNEVVQTSMASQYSASVEGSYFVQVVEGTCSYISDAVTITKQQSNLSKPVLTFEPQSGNICGDNGAVVIRITNIDSYTTPVYQWYKDGAVVAANGNYAIYKALEAGRYRVKVTEGGCSIMSEEVVTTKDNSSIVKPVLTVTPSTGIISFGNNVKIEVTNTSAYTNPIYIWYRNNETEVQRSANPILSTNIEGKYFVQVVEGGCASYSDDVELVEGVGITATIVGGQTVCAGSEVELTIEIVGGVQPFRITYTTDDGTTVETIENITGQVYKFDVIPFQTTTYKLLSVEDNSGVENPSLESSTTIKVINTITYDLASEVAICQGSRINLYKQVKNVNIDDYLVEIKESGRIITEEFVSPEEETTYQIKVLPVNNLVCQSELKNITVKLYPASDIEVSLLNGICPGEDQIMIPYTGTYSADLEYTLTFSKDALYAGFENVKDFISLPQDTIKLDIPLDVKTGVIYEAELAIRNATCTETHPVAIKVGTVPQITGQPETPTSLCEGISEINLSVKAEGDKLTYQWYKDGVQISGATQSNYKEIYNNDLNGTYHVEVYGLCGTTQTAISTPVEVKENDLLVQQKWDDMLIVLDDYNKFTSYQWYVDGVTISGAKSQYHSNPNGFNGDYTVRAYLADGTYQESCPITMNTIKKKREDVKLYPNPVLKNNEITIEILKEIAGTSEIKIEIIDVLGKTIYKGFMKGRKANVPVGAASGTYVVKVVSEMDNINEHFTLIVK